MSEHVSSVYSAIDEEFADQPASTRRKFVAGAAGAIGGLGLLSLPASAMAANDPQTILNVAATAEVLATIVNTIGPRKVPLDTITGRNIRAAAREELIHYQVLVSHGVGGRPLTKKIWVPDKVFSNESNLLSTVIIGDQIFINAYMIGTTAFGNAGNGKLARITSEFMGAEAVHRALARQSLGLLGNDRAFMKYNQREQADGPGHGLPGFTDILQAVKQLQAAGFGFGKPGHKPGSFYDFDKIKGTVPNPPEVNTRKPA